METICGSPAPSSDPEDYIEEHPLEYRELTYYGTYTLRYCFSRFERGEEPLIFSLPSDGVLTGQMWYSAFKSNALSLMEQYSEPELAERYPASCLRLGMLGEVQASADVTPLLPFPADSRFYTTGWGSGHLKAAWRSRSRGRRRYRVTAVAAPF